MRIELFLLKLSIDFVSGTVYKLAADVIPEGHKVISVEDAPSVINCAIRCNIRKAHYVYDTEKCTCLMYLEDTTEKMATLTGQFFKVSCDVFVIRHFSHPVALHYLTVRYSTKVYVKSRCTSLQELP